MVGCDMSFESLVRIKRNAAKDSRFDSHQIWTIPTLKAATRLRPFISPPSAVVPISPIAIMRIVRVDAGLYVVGLVPDALRVHVGAELLLLVHRCVGIAGDVERIGAGRSGQKHACRSNQKHALHV